MSGFAAAIALFTLSLMVPAAADAVEHDAASAVALQLAGRARRLCRVPLGEVIAAVRVSLARRLVLVLGWAWLGWHLLAR